jgi:hypothetical protein
MIERVPPSGDISSARDMRRHREMRRAMLVEQPHEVFNGSQLPHRARPIAAPKNVVASVIQIGG